MNQPERWQLTDAGAESYERYQVPSVFAPLAKIFLAHVPLGPGQRVLDLACGTGIVARLAASIVGPEGRVVGIDLNEGMLEVARRHSPEGAAPIEWHRGDVAALPMPESACDVALCQQGLQFFPDKAAALAEMYRVLCPGGWLALCVWRSIDHSPCATAAADGLRHHIGVEAATRIGAPFVLGDAATLRALVAAAGFRDIDITAAVLTRRMLPPAESIPGFLASTPVGPDITALEEPARERMIAEIGDALAAYRNAEGMAIPQGTHIVLAKK
ncbi:MAG: methyltransferase domain-containing protein [Alphaproteobacteria bacterium]|nr:methyltransferase domain-containing protein [Alphaproteobacteria bacterium]